MCKRPFRSHPLRRFPFCQQSGISLPARSERPPSLAIPVRGASFLLHDMLAPDNLPDSPTRLFVFSSQSPGLRAFFAVWMRTVVTYNLLGRVF